MSRRQPVTYPYPPCPLTERYPILQRIPPHLRRAWVIQAEAGIELSAQQNAMLGMLAEPGGILVPSDGSLTEAQLNFTFPLENRRVLAEIVALGMQKEGAA